ncbi:MAG: MBL fold metallo-hydrolase [Pseudomonadota bacterium]
MRRFTILGCGSSGGVPRLGGHWGACDPANPKNRRRRCSLLIEEVGADGVTRVLIDTSPDMREQLLDAGVGRLDAVVYTHSHADHVHGIDDLRMIVFNMRARLPVYADSATEADLRQRFGYVFEAPEGSPYPPILDLHPLDGALQIEGPGGVVDIAPFDVTHGAISAKGIRSGDVAYLPDVSDIPDPAWEALDGLDTWIVDALRLTPHPSHSHLDKTLEWIARAKPRQAIITNMHIDLDHAETDAATPDHVRPAHDGLTITRP